MLQCLSQLDFNTTLRMNTIKGCDVTLDDARIMWKIWGPLVIKTKGNSTQQTTTRKFSNIVAVPREFISAQKSITVSVDFFFVKTYVFLIMVSKKVCFTTTSHCSTRKVQHYWIFLKEVLMMYYDSTWGFGVQAIGTTADGNAKCTQIGSCSKRGTC